MKKSRSSFCYKCLGNDFKNLGFPNYEPEKLYSCPKCGVSWHFICLNGPRNRSAFSYDDLRYHSQIYCLNCKKCNACKEEVLEAPYYFIKCVSCTRCFHQKCLDPCLKRKRKRTDSLLYPNKSSSPATPEPWRCKVCIENKTLVRSDEKKTVAKSSVDESPNNSTLQNDYSNLNFIITDVDKAIFKKLVDAQKKAEKFANQDLPQGAPLPFEIKFGDLTMKTEYSSPYPPEYRRKQIYICPFCLIPKKTEAETHSRCSTYPPGNEIYRHNQLSVFEVDGEISKLYCRQLSLLAKLWLAEKALYFEVEVFNFYVLTKRDAEPKRELFRHHQINVACIMILPAHQGQGYGTFLIGFSYFLAKLEGIPGTPEKPLSDKGNRAFLSYWTTTLIDYFRCRRSKNNFILNDISKDTGMIVSDIVTTLQHMKIIESVELCEADAIIIDWEFIEASDQNKGPNNIIPFCEGNLFWCPVNTT